MPADIALPISVSSSTPDVDLGSGRDSVVNQSVGDHRQAFNQEYQRQVDARNEQRSRQKIQESRQQDARQEKIRSDERAAQRADRQADDTRRAEQNRRDERISQAERKRQQQGSGKHLPENGSERARQVEQDSRRAQDLASQRASQQDQANIAKNRVDSSRREGVEAETRQAQQAQSNQLEAQQQTEKSKNLKDLQQRQNLQQLQDQKSDNANAESANIESAKTDSVQRELTVEAIPAVDEVVLSPYILRQLSETEVTSANEVTETSSEGAEAGSSMSSLAQWMEQTLALDQDTVDQQIADVDSANTVASTVGGAVNSAANSQANSALIDKIVVQEPASTTEPTITRVLASEVSNVSPEDRLGEGEGKINDPAKPLDINVKSELQASKADSAEALRNKEDVARLLDAKRSAENPLEKALPGSKVLPLSQAIESVNRSGRLAEPTFLKQSALSSEAPSNGLSLDELKQMMQERKALLEGGRIESGASTLKAGAEDVMASQSDKLLALDKRLSQGMEGLRQLRIPGQEAKKASVDDNVKPSSFGRALEQMSSIKTEEVKPLSTSIATPMNKPGFIPEFNQRIMMMIGQKIQAAEIKLNPEELGSIDVSIKFNQDQQANIVFASQHSVTRDALEQGAQRLRDMLEQSGVDVDNVDIQENLTRDRHHQGNDDESSLATDSKGQKGVSDDSEEMEGQVAKIESDSLVDFYA